MKNEIMTFVNESFGEIRSMYVDGEAWFVGKDVAIALGYSNPRKALIDHIDIEDKNDGVTIRDSIGREQKPVLINESGLYSLILSSRLDTAKEFKRWVTATVLPMIRKHGAYMEAETLHKSMSDPRELAKLLNSLADELDKNKKLTAENAILSVKASYYDQILNSKDAIPVTQIAKDYGMSAVTFNKLLFEYHIQFPRCGTWILYQDYADRGYTQSRTFIINKEKTTVHTCWTQAGRLFLYEFLKARGRLPLCER